MSNTGDKRRRSVRLRGFDYAYRGFFFITICTHNKKSTLGKIINDEFHSSDIGRIVEKCWREIPEHFANVYLDEWVIMPNHLHGIIVIRYPKGYDPARKGTACRAPSALVSTYENFGKPTEGSLPTIIRSFKSAVSRLVNAQLGSSASPLWQRNYFEHVIRDEGSLNKIRNYLWENPIHWYQDEYYFGER